ncbi:5869_t:CDS:10, partial [Scutellospora calospora]
MKVVALISGGKDSCFNMMHCVANGHQIVALANLKPLTDSQKDELDSFLYQTVGHDAISYYAECMNLPLYRREIFGQSLIQESDYKQTIGDETEDLFELLKEVKEANSDIQGVSVGAILSNYQRVRVENVCNRLGLIPIAYLWRRSQKELLSEMINARINAILIKNEKYDVHICGEGGEYETFTLDCPLFIKRLHVEESEIITHSDNAFAEVAYLRLKKLIVMDKPVNSAIMNLIKVPAWDDDFENVLSELEVFKGENVLNAVPKIDIDYIPEMNNHYMDLYNVHANPPYFAISGTTAYNHKISRTARSSIDTIEDETHVCMKNLEGMRINARFYKLERLIELGLDWTDINNHAYIAGQIVLELDVWKFSVGCICFVDEDISFEVVRKAWECVRKWRKGENCFKVPPILYITAPSLPRGAKVEWQVLLHDGRINHKHYDDYLEEDSRILNFEPVSGEDTLDTINSCIIKITTLFISPILNSVITIKVEKSITLTTLLTSIKLGLLKIHDQFHKYNHLEDKNDPSSKIFWISMSFVKVFYSEKIEVDVETLERGVKSMINSKFPSDMKPAITFVPVVTIDGDCTA